jgi:hypothetical protein
MWSPLPLRGCIWPSMYDSMDDQLGPLLHRSIRGFFSGWEDGLFESERWQAFIGSFLEELRNVDICE